MPNSITNNPRPDSASPKMREGGDFGVALIDDDGRTYTWNPFFPYRGMPHNTLITGSTEKTRSAFIEQLIASSVRARCDAYVFVTGKTYDFDLLSHTIHRINLTQDAISSINPFLGLTRDDEFSRNEAQGLICALLGKDETGKGFDSSEMSLEDIFVEVALKGVLDQHKEKTTYRHLLEGLSHHEKAESLEAASRVSEFLALDAGDLPPKNDPSLAFPKGLTLIELPSQGSPDVQAILAQLMMILIIHKAHSGGRKVPFYLVLGDDPYINSLSSRFMRRLCQGLRLNYGSLMVSTTQTSLSGLRLREVFLSYCYWSCVLPQDTRCLEASKTHEILRLMAHYGEPLKEDNSGCQVRIGMDYDEGFVGSFSLTPPAEGTHSPPAYSFDEIIKIRREQQLALIEAQREEEFQESLEVGALTHRSYELSLTEHKRWLKKRLYVLLALIPLSILPFSLKPSAINLGVIDIHKLVNHQAQYLATRYPNGGVPKEKLEDVAQRLKEEAQTWAKGKKVMLLAKGAIWVGEAQDYTETLIGHLEQKMEDENE